MKFLEPDSQTGSIGKVINNICGRLPEKIHAYTKKDGINNSGYDYPFPKPVFLNETVRFRIRLNSYDNFFEQELNLLSKYKKQGTRSKV